MCTKFLKTTRVATGVRPHQRNLFKHIPPVAFPVKWRDISSGIIGGFFPAMTYDKFTDALASRVGSDTCILVGSGRSALTLILLSLIDRGDSKEVIVPAYSCSTVLQSVLTAGLTPRFIDISPETFDFDREAVLRLIENEPLAVIGVHLYGLANDYSEVIQAAREQGVTFIEDAAQSFGAKVNRTYVGMQGDVGFYSLGLGKCLPAGKGGVIVGRPDFIEGIHHVLGKLDPNASKRGFGSSVRSIGYKAAVSPFGWWWVKRTRINPASAGEDFSGLPDIGFAKLPAVNAGLGDSLLKRADTVHGLWRDNAAKLCAELQDFNFLKIPRTLSSSQPVYLRFPVVIETHLRRERIFKKLEYAGIGVSRSYQFTLPDIIRAPGEFPGAEKLARNLITLPTNHFLRDDDIAKICDVFASDVGAL